MIFEHEYDGEINEIPVKVWIEVTKDRYQNHFGDYDYEVTDWQIIAVGAIDVTTEEQRQWFKSLVGSTFADQMDDLIERAMESFEE
jgi:hypothetical protein